MYMYKYKLIIRISLVFSLNFTMNTLVLTFFIFITTFSDYALSQLSDEMQQVAKLLHDNCVGEVGVDEALITQTQDGSFAEDDKLKCYMKCVFSQLAVLSDDGEIDAEAFAALLPDNMVEHGTKMIEVCKGVGGANGCEVAFNLNKCFYEFNPAEFMLI
uniref:Odorant binding protein 10 n=1 Tax=Subpsaltria yangi TaxID=1195109 RepID=A0A385IUQ8_9HEMI|nr:odorant binding protein 10 [Subpsaltria yangi]